MRWIGICERAFDLMCTRAATRTIAPGQTLAMQQIVQVWVAESRASINAARLMVLNTAERIERDGAYNARDDIAMIKFYVAGISQQCSIGRFRSTGHWACRMIRRSPTGIAMSGPHGSMMVPTRSISLLSPVGSLTVREYSKRWLTIRSSPPR